MVWHRFIDIAACFPFCPFPISAGWRRGADGSAGFHAQSPLLKATSPCTDSQSRFGGFKLLQQHTWLYIFFPPSFSLLVIGVKSQIWWFYPQSFVSKRLRLPSHKLTAKFIQRTASAEVGACLREKAKTKAKPLKLMCKTLYVNAWFHSCFLPESMQI